MRTLGGRAGKAEAIFTCQTNTDTGMRVAPKDKQRYARDAQAVKSPEPSVPEVLERAVNVLFQIYVLRGECSTAARELLRRGESGERGVEDCARLDDALAKSYRTLQTTIRAIQASRSRRRNRIR